ncbi:acyltransferase Pun1-like [Lycium barbarum]|uniref:acyltransferase Pun1-like n=1 Tax=Lycium barbarum TaxID=112863 RepID=UPI00293EB40E|nr:acyltransferase Pun1-like [Lycium barbarum]
MSISVAFFYPKTGTNVHKSYELLEKSLSKTLSFYYPYAGRLNKDGCSVDCNDMGVELSHVRVHCPMSQILKQPYTHAKHVVFPVDQPHGHQKGNLAITQVSHFDCGGIAIGGCISHKIGDGCTASNFFNNWGVLTRDISATPSPHFVGKSIYPQSNNPYVISTIEFEEPTYLGKRFIFPIDKLNSLKAKIANESGVQNPSRTEIVSALLYKCAHVAVAGRRSTNFDSFKPSSLFQVANMRQRLNPPLSQDACGNIISGYFVKINNERDINYPKLVSELRKEKMKINTTKNVIISEVTDSLEKGNTPFHSNIIDNFFCTSLMSYPFYKIDFGWGRPARVSFATGPFNRWFYLLDNQSGGGVEVIVYLDEQAMAIFERDPELLEFASPISNI